MFKNIIRKDTKMKKYELVTSQKLLYGSEIRIPTQKDRN